MTKEYIGDFTKTFRPKRMSFTELGNIIRNQNPDHVSKSGQRVFLFENLILEDQNKLVFDTRFDSFFGIHLKNCFFLSDEFIYINGMSCTEDVIFDNCYFSQKLIINNGSFSKYLYFKNIHCLFFDLSGGKFNQIILEKSEIGLLYIDGGDSLNCRSVILIISKHYQNPSEYNC